MKLVYEHYFTDGYTYGNNVYIPFEYSSKDDFVWSILDKVEKANNNGEIYIEILGQLVEISEAENIEYKVSTLEDWFKTNKILI